jgi:hypothetical protein
MRDDKFTEDQMRELREELLRVRAQAGQIDRKYMFADSSQRVVLRLPKSLVHLAEFIAIMETRPMPGSLHLWQYVSGIGADDPTPSRNAKLIMRAWMEEEIMTRTHVAMLQLQAEVKERD